MSNISKSGTMKIVAFNSYRSIYDYSATYQEDNIAIILELAKRLNVPMDSLYNNGTGLHSINCGEVDTMKRKLENAIPKFIVKWLILFSILSGATFSVFVIELVQKTRWIPYYILLLVFCASFGMMATIVYSLNEWRKFLVGEEK